MATLEERLALAESKMRQPKFRQNKGLGNEVGYYIFDYAPEDELAVRQCELEVQITQCIFMEFYWDYLLF